ncbi:MAG: hypothetical protein QXL67_04405 [Candidatus Bathyarchaeia archaeon]
MIVITGQDPDYHYYYIDKVGAGILLNNVLSWACGRKPIGGEVLPIDKGALSLTALQTFTVSHWWLIAILLKKRR